MPNMLSPRDLVSRRDNMDETVQSSLFKYANLCSLIFFIKLFNSDMSQITKQIAPRCEKTGLRGFRPGPTQTGLYSHRRWLEA